MLTEVERRIDFGRNENWHEVNLLIVSYGGNPPPLFLGGAKVVSR